MGKICVALSGPEMVRRAAEIVTETPFLEFRLDSLPNPRSVLAELAAFLSAHPLCVAIGTCRRKANGGAFEGTAAEELAMLALASAACCHIVDVSLETAEELDEDVRRLVDPAFVLISWHDFKKTPPLAPVYERMQRFRPDFCKIVSTARTLSDNIAVFDLLEQHGVDGNLVALAMGQPGLPSRVLGPRFGSAFTFAAAHPTELTAPGQIAARTLNELYRLNSIESSTRVYGVAGKPISGSMSPLMQNNAFRRETVNAVYLALETDSVDDLLRLMERVPLHGASITMPLKQEILPHLENSDPLSAKIGACNTLVRREGKLYGFNTDVGGILGPLEKRLPLRDAQVLVLGAGGAARAAVFGLISRGAEVAILNRTPQTAQKLAKESGAHVQRRDTLARTRFDVIINATAFGMGGNQAGPAPLAAAEMNCAYFFDLVYNPIDTPLIRIARDKGIGVIPGVEMFVQQGARQFEIWTGKPAPTDEMMRSVIHTLRQGEPAATSPPSRPASTASSPDIAVVPPTPPVPLARKSVTPPPAPSRTPATKPTAATPPARPSLPVNKPAANPMPTRPALRSKTSAAPLETSAAPAKNSAAPAKNSASTSKPFAVSSKASASTAKSSPKPSKGSASLSKRVASGSRASAIRSKASATRSRSSAATAKRSASRKK